MLPTGIAKATHADSGGHFYVDGRPIRAQGPTNESVWPDMGTLPMDRFVDVSDGENGFAVLSDTLAEYEVLEDNEKTLALSLLRAVKNWIVTGHVGSDFPSQKGGQCPGKHCIRYALAPHKGNWQDADIAGASETFNTPAVPVQTNPHEGKLPAGQKSFLEIDNSLIRLSCLKKTRDRDSYIIRLYNPTAQARQGRLKIAFGVRQAWLTDLNETRLEEIEIPCPEAINVQIAPCKIVTLEIKP